MTDYMFLKRVLERGVQAPVFCGNLQGQAGENGFPRKPHMNPILFLRKSPNISRNLREFTGERHLGILYSSSLLAMSSSKIRGLAVGIANANNINRNTTNDNNGKN